MTIRRPLKIVLFLVCLFGFPIVAFWIGGRFHEAQNISKEYRSEDNFARLEVMLLTYYEKHGTFPPTQFESEAGGPVHSWRVLLVPYTDRDYRERYSQYDFSQEWNSTNNLHALGRMAHFGWFSTNGEGDVAHYLAIGENDEWPSNKPLRSRLITKGEDRFLLVEDPDSRIHWMEPKY